MANILTYERCKWFDRRVRQNDRPNARHIAERFEISHRQAQRDIDFLRDRFGAPLTYDHARRGYAYSDDSFELTRLQATQEEILSVLLARQLLSQSAGGVISQTIRKFGKKLVELAVEFGIDESRLEDCFSADWHGYSPSQSETFRQVAGALLDHRLLYFVYQSPSTGQITERIAEPHHLQHYMASWVLIAWCRNRCNWRKFYLARMSDLQAGAETFVPRERNEWEPQVKGSFGIFQGTEPVKTVLRFSPFRARWIREQVWHPDQQLRDLPDGGLEMTLPVADFREIKLCILQYGADVTVIEPEDLKTEIADEIRKMSQLYVEANDEIKK